MAWLKAAMSCVVWNDQRQQNFFRRHAWQNKGFVEQQIHAQYPHAEITEADYNIFKPKPYRGRVLVAQT